jgi:hypothetical protein
MVEVEEKGVRELFKQSQRDKYIIMIVFVVFTILFAVGASATYYIDDMLLILVSVIFTGQVLMCLVMLWFYTRIILFLKLHMEE